MIEQSNSFYQNIRSAQGNQKIFDFGCACHLAHFCAAKGAEELSANVQDFVIDTYYHFRRRPKWKKQLTVFMNFNNTVTKLEK